MASNFHKIASNLYIGINDYLDDLLNDISTEVSNEKDSPAVLVLNITTAYWQYYPKTKTRFTRNFGRSFPKISKHIVNQLTAIQSSVKREDFDDQKMYDVFIKHKFNHERVQLTKIVSGVSVLPHIDNGREYVINIGIRNSNTCKIYVSDNQNTKSFRQENLKSFIMEDNEAYIINVDKAHAVDTLVTEDDNLDRYLITYMLSEC